MAIKSLRPNMAYIAMHGDGIEKEVKPYVSMVKTKPVATSMAPKQEMTFMERKLFEAGMHKELGELGLLREEPIPKPLIPTGSFTFTPDPVMALHKEREEVSVTQRTWASKLMDEILFMFGILSATDYVRLTHIGESK